MPDPVTVAIIGLGNMGAPMAKRLIDAGYRVIGSDPSETARRRITDAGGQAVSRAADAASAATTVILMLPDSQVVDAVITDLLAAQSLTVDTVVVDMSSSEPKRSRANAARLLDAGVRFVDAPVSGGVRGAAAGTLTVMLGGHVGDVEAIRPILSTLGTLRHVGPVGAGHAMKALNNLVSATHLWITSEAVVIANQHGIDTQTVLDVLNGSSGRSASSERKWPDFIQTCRYDSGFTARLMLKDARIAIGVARDAGLSTRVGEELVTSWAEATDHLGPTADHTEIARWLADRAPTPR